jgi:ribosomal protein S18 acetylase RimI-like enzyme
MSRTEAVTIREAVLADAVAIAEVHVASWRWAYRGHLPDDTLDALDPVALEQRWTSTMSNPSASVLVAIDQGAVVGFASVGPADDDDAVSGTAHLFAIYLVPEAAGRGIGRALLGRAEELMRTAGFTQASLWVLETNARARAFYERAGWAWDGTRSSHEVQCSNLPIVRYVRSL